MFICIFLCINDFDAINTTKQYSLSIHGYWSIIFIIIFHVHTYGPFHDKTDWYYVWGSTISLQNTLILCLGLDHFMTNHTDTMSGAWPFHVKTHWYYVWGLTISEWFIYHSDLTKRYTCISISKKCDSSIIVT